MTDPPIANTEQAEAWNSDEGRHWAAHQDRYDAMSGAFTDQLLAAAEIAGTDVVLDIGCGNGQSTRLAAQRAADGRAVGFDLSAPMLERAAETAAREGISNVAFARGDAQVHPFETGAFDVAISRFGVMFFADPAAAFANIGAAVRADGRLAFVCWRELARNEWLMVPAGAALAFVPLPDLGAPGAPGPFSLAAPERTEAILTEAGWVGPEMRPVEARMRLGDDAADAVGFLRGTSIARALLDKADPPTAARALEAVGEALRAHEQPGGLYLTGAAWLVTARRPGG